jgi:hypothetical protein
LGEGKRLVWKRWVKKMALERGCYCSMAVRDLVRQPGVWMEAVDLAFLSAMQLLYGW